MPLSPFNSVRSRGPNSVSLPSAPVEIQLRRTKNSVSMFLVELTAYIINSEI